jgi:flagellin-like hook-associated protein FlgL
MSATVLSSAASATLISLQNTADLMGVTQQRLATGKKVMSASDDPVAYFQAKALTDRANDFASYLNNMSDAVQTLSVANNGISSMTAVINQMKSLASSAQASISGAGGSATATKVASGAGANLAAVATVADADTLTIAVGGGATTTITVGTAATYTIQNLVDAINAVAGINATLQSDGVLKVSALQAQDIVLGGNVASKFGINGTHAASATVPVTVASLQAQYNSLRTQMGQIVSDANYNGTNLLAGGNMNVAFSAAGSGMTVSGVQFDPTASSPDITLSAANWTGSGAITSSANELDAVLATLRGQTQAFGTNVATIKARQEFTGAMIGALSAGAGNLTNADMNTESANMLALQTRNQMSISALSMAMQAQNSILKLF